MRKFILNFIAAVITVNSIALPSVWANSEIQSQAVSADVRELLKVRQQLVLAQKEMDQYGVVSNTTLVSLSALALGLGSFIAGTTSLILFRQKNSPFDFISKASNFGTMIGAHSVAAFPILSSLVQDLKELLGKDVRTDIQERSEKLEEIFDAALTSGELSHDQTLQVLALKNIYFENSQKNSKTPGYIKVINFIDGAVALLAILSLGASILTFDPAIVAITMLPMVPISFITTILRAMDESHTIRSHKKALKTSIEYIDSVIAASSSQPVLIIP